MKKKTIDDITFWGTCIFASLILLTIAFVMVYTVTTAINDINFCEAKLGQHASRNYELGEEGQITCCKGRLIDHEIKEYCEVYEYVR